MTEAVRAHIEEKVGLVQSVEVIGGGCIAHASRVSTAAGDVFVKWGDASVAATFEAEATGLQVLAAANTSLRIPKVISCDASAGCLILEWIEAGPKSASFSRDFGRALSQLHRYEGKGYGFDQDNFIGRTLQHNDWRSSWPAFFREMRLMPQVKMARKANLWQTSWDQAIERLYQRLNDLLPEQPERSILHGDLWAGNYMVGVGGKAVLIDPACYYGHRETDLAMTELFGGFDRDFHAAYQEAWPLAPGYEERRSIYNLYHLINHLNLFGGGYASGIAAALKSFE